MNGVKGSSVKGCPSERRAPGARLRGARRCLDRGTVAVAVAVRGTGSRERRVCGVCRTHLRSCTPGR